MIFSKFFKTKINWQHKDATVRVMAINEELSADNNEQLVILTELLNQDSSDIVRRAALLKIGTFDCYLEASRNNSQDKIKQFAAKQIHDILATDHNIVLSNAIKENLLAEQAKEPSLSTALLEAWLAHEQDNDMMILLYQQISERKTTSHLLTQSFTQKQSPVFQTFLLNQVDDAKVLEKLSKKACNEDIANQIENKLTTIQLAIEKPQKLEKQIQLTLAKLQALKDISEFAEYKKRKSLLISQWQTLQTEFDLFSADEVSVFNEKYQTIIDHLDKLFVAKAEQYQQQIISDKLTHDKQQDKKEFTQQINQISQGITTAVFSSEQFDDEHFSALLVKLKTRINNSVLNTTEQKTFLAQVSELTNRLDKIPEITESVSQATQLIAKISQVSLPKTLSELNDRQKVYNDWLKAWRVIELKTAGILPESIVQSQKEIMNNWKSGLKTLQSQQKEWFFQHKKKLQDIKRLINNGKFKVCFGLFKGVKESIHLLSPQQQVQLQRDFDDVSKKMTELSDWEHYIATPRKQELLVTVETLVNTPLDNPNEQAAKVKEYRSIWNSLGHADEELDKQLNEQFNQLCEQAFAPCRLFYAEQDKMREQHLVVRQSIISRAEQLVSEFNKAKENQTIDFKKVDGKLHNLQKEWNAAGEIDRTQYKKLQQQFRDIITPIKLAINEFQANNAQEKQSLIMKAETLITNDDVFSAIESAKQLQKTWREIGFAGNHKENELWQKFRQVNDLLFEKRQQVKSAEQAAFSEQQQAFETQVIDIETSLTSAIAEETPSALSLVSDQAQSLLTDVIAIKPVIKPIASRLEKIIKQAEQSISQLNEVKAKKTWLNLFELLVLNSKNKLTLDELKASELFNGLSGYWQKRVQDTVKLTSAVNGDERFDKTLIIEILAKAESPAELSTQRMKMQVQLMQEQMLSGNEIDLSNLLVEWLGLGCLSESDLPFIERLRPIYCK